jgi:uncharacterized protein YbcV (DUF1398 family)
MTTEQVLAIQDAVRASITATKTFPEIIGTLIEAGVERYHADYSRGESTFYFADGDSLVVASPWGRHPTGTHFSAADVEAAVRQSQRNEHTFLDFVRKTMAAGCVGYFVQISGRRAQYFGRNGEMHVEPFPGSP